VYNYAFYLFGAALNVFFPSTCSRPAVFSSLDWGERSGPGSARWLVGKIV
jgi:hypothetical protein